MAAAGRRFRYKSLTYTDGIISGRLVWLGIGAKARINLRDGKSLKEVVSSQCLCFAILFPFFLPPSSFQRRLLHLQSISHLSIRSFRRHGLCVRLSHLLNFFYIFVNSLIRVYLGNLLFIVHVAPLKKKTFIAEVQRDTSFRVYKVGKELN